MVKSNKRINKKIPVLKDEASRERIEWLENHGYDVEIIYVDGIKYILKKKINQNNCK